LTRQKKKRLTQQDLRALGVQPGLLATRYPAGEDRAQIRRLTAETRNAPSFGRNLTGAREHADITQESEGEIDG
jgi:hypothetical protein